MFRFTVPECWNELSSRVYGGTEVPNFPPRVRFVEVDPMYLLTVAMLYTLLPSVAGKGNSCLYRLTLHEIKESIDS